MNTDELIRRYNAGERDFSGVDLCTADLSSKTFDGINLSHANLGAANLRCTKLNNADLSHATLTKATFCNTIMPDGSVRNDNCEQGSM